MLKRESEKSRTEDDLFISPLSHYHLFILIYFLISSLFSPSLILCRGRSHCQAPLCSWELLFTPICHSHTEREREVGASGEVDRSYVKKYRAGEERTWGEWKTTQRNETEEKNEDRRHTRAALWQFVSTSWCTYQESVSQEWVTRPRSLFFFLHPLSSSSELKLPQTSGSVSRSSHQRRDNFEVKKYKTVVKLEENPDLSLTSGVKSAGQEIRQS